MHFEPIHWPRSQGNLPLTIRFYSPMNLGMPEDSKQLGALLIVATLVAAIRLRGEPVKPSPKLTATITDSVQLCVLVWRRCRAGDQP
jgi:hypothetical protein